MLSDEDSDGCASDKVSDRYDSDNKNIALPKELVAICVYGVVRLFILKDAISNSYQSVYLYSKHSK